MTDEKQIRCEECEKVEVKNVGDECEKCEEELSHQYKQDEHYYEMAYGNDLEEN